ncbi:CHAP domain-containing protein (plasmid) [Qingshengfaniella alkalisoli]|uniref:CHAP domain-containing protein n=1 Tax=Qingshengfaniella alkalisoli TaxID=2599296 RepID=A0A5B8IBX4_9RHOB|nr:CHAP domain-containing protein [Qingshengfaniella alkalisoli]
MRNPGRAVRTLLSFGALVFLVAACSGTSPGSYSSGLHPERVTRAMTEVQKLKARGARVWCVPFARNLSGVNIRGNAGTWWDQAGNTYARGKEPQVGAVMAFSATGRNPRGHVAVVSELVEPRKVLIDHANWKRNQVSLRMAVVDISERNDWSAVRVESQPGNYGRVYPLDGFIYPTVVQ